MGTGNPKTMSGWQSLMEEAPGFVKGGGGTKIYRRRVRPEDLSCQYCLYAKGRKCTLPECMCIDERIEAGGMPISVILEALCKGDNLEFRERCKKLMHREGEKFMQYRDSFHERRFEQVVLNERIRDRTLLAVVFLLTADQDLWRTVKPDIVNNMTVRFSSIRLNGIGETGYTLYGGAKDLYLGTKTLCLNDLANSEIVDREAFELIVTAMAIKRYGMEVLRNRKDGKK